MKQRALFIVIALFTIAVRTTATNPILPSHLSNSQYYQRIAQLLGWRDGPQKETLCRGDYTLPAYIEKNSIIDRTAPVQISAEGPETFRLDGVSELQDNIVVEQAGQIIYADKAFIYRDNKSHRIKEITLSGLVRIYQGKSLIVTNEGSITLYPRSATLKQSIYHYSAESKAFDAWGSAKTAQVNEAKVITLKEATYSTCPPNTTPAWQISASTIILDKPNNLGKAYNAVLKFKSIPVLYSPYYSFQLDNQRKTGLLTPVFGHNTDSGYYFGLPFYLNLAPNYDLLLTPQYYGERGFKANAKFRYLTPTSQGSISASILPNDTLFGSFREEAINTYSNPANYNQKIYAPYLDELESDSNFRGMLSMTNHSIFNPNLRLRYYVNLVSDDYYMSNITSGSIIDNPLATDLLNLLQLQYSDDTWDISTYLEAYQTLHLIGQVEDQQQTLDQYARYPSFDANSYHPLNDHLASELSFSFNNFSYSSSIEPNKPTGERLHLRSGLLLNFENSAGYIKPQIWLDNVAYTVDNTNATVSANSSRTLPILDVDAGLKFFREFSWKSQSYQQTLEPRLFYLYVPYTNQNNLPNFDTIQLPFFFDQLFSLNTFEGVDRIENANQISLGFTSDIINTSANRKFLSFDLGSIYYIDQPQVCLVNDCTIKPHHLSPIITDVAFYPSEIFALSTSYAWDPETSETDNASLTLGYHRDPKRVFNLSYVFVGANNNSLSTFSGGDSTANNYTSNSSHLVGSFAWPLSERWSFLGQSDYNLGQKRLDSLYAGLQYDTCCWALRFVVQELYDNSNGSLGDNYNTGYFIEINLKGLASFGSGADATLSSAIPGYG